MDITEQQKAQSFLSFKVGGEVFAAPTANILNILEMEKITRVPKAPNYMKGVMNLRGSVLPVLDTRLKFGLTATEYTYNTCILVMEVPDKNESVRIGAIVDNVLEVLELHESDIYPPPGIGPGFNTKYLAGMAKKDNNFIMILKIENIFNDDEIINISELDTETALQ